MALLEAWDLYRFYHTGDDETRALRGVSLELHPGEIVAVVGPSGSGKSTLLACLAGLDDPDGGHVTLLGRRLSRRPEAERAARRAAGVGILLQTGNLFPHLTVAENLFLQQQLASRVDRPRLEALLDEVGLTARRDARPSTLSGGEAARAGFAVALAAAPPVLLADEPTGEVDAATEALLLDCLGARRQAGEGTLVATHSAALAARADRILHLRDGRLVDA